MTKNQNFAQDQFASNFQRFITPYNCKHHNKELNFVCIDKQCTSKGLICSICITIKGEHKNHDAIQITQFFQNFCKPAQHNVTPSQVKLINNKIEELYDELLKNLTDFHQKISDMIKLYINRKNAQHQKRQLQIKNDNIVIDIFKCNFKSIEQFSEALKQIIEPNQQLQSHKSETFSKKKYQSNIYMQNLKGQIKQINYHLNGIQKQLEDILDYDRVYSSFKNPICMQTPSQIYFGDINPNQKSGRGLKYDKTQQIISIGSFYNGILSGYGQSYNKKGDYYVGQFNNNLKEGYGKYLWATNKNIYQGYFLNGKRHGTGIFKWTDGSKYIGQFMNGHQQGYGILLRDFDQIEYQGFWLEGMFHGQGTQYFENGQRFQGNFKFDQFHGHGKLYKSDQTIFGIWRQNELVEVVQKQQKSSDNLSNSGGKNK